MCSVAYELDHYEKHREDNKTPSDEESILLLKEEQIKWKLQPPAQIGFQDFAAWEDDEVRQSLYSVFRTLLMSATEMGSLG